MPNRAVARRTKRKDELAIPIVECPPELSPAARKQWDRIAPGLASSGRLTPFDAPTLALFCTAYADWIAANEAIQTFGAVMKSPTGYPVQSPYVSIAAKHCDTVIRLAAEFGLTPASRGRLPSPSKSESWWADIPVLDASDFKPLVIDEPES
jgi:P27 family predicted phage terminase small subunit